jgi:hypothetical protein
MGLLTVLVKWPYIPLRGVVAIGELLREQVDRELSHPSAIRTEMEEIERQREAGLISAAEEQQAEQKVIDRLMGDR